MKFTNVLSCAFAASIWLAGAIPAQAEASSDAAKQFSRDQIEQLVAPIALYPDSLLTQVMMAATYPLEVVEAARWLKANPGVKGDALDKALLDEDWDPSVKGLCTVPDVLQRMSDNLEWTQDLGDAFLGQQNDVLAAVQVMRSKANDAGNLKTTPQQEVVVKQEPAGQVIIIEQAQPEVVYVPQYSSAVVYGPTYAPPAPYYPGMYAPYGYGLLAFGTGMAVGAAIWGDCDWGCCGYGGNNNVNVNVNNYNNFNNRVNHNGGNWNSGNRNWQHNPEHRKGVNYRDSKTASQFGAKGGQNRVSRDQARGFADKSGIQSGRVGDRGGAGDRGGIGSGGNRGGAGDRGGIGSGGSANRGGANVGNRAGAGAGSSNRAGSVGSSNRAGSSGSRGSAASRPSSGGAFKGSGSSSFDRASSSRGASSRGGGGYSRSGGSYSRSSGGGGGSFSRGGGGGGGSRGGGGGGRGGGGRR